VASRRFPFIAQIGVGILAGAATGSLLGSRAHILGELGLSIVKLLKLFAAPLLFFAIADAFSKTQVGLGQARRLLKFSLLNAAVAGAIAIALDRCIGLSRMIDFGAVRKFVESGTAQAPQARSLGPDWSHFSSLLPSNLLEPFLANQIIGVVLLAVLSGAVIRSTSSSRLAELCSDGLAFFSKILGWIIHAVPFAVFGVIAQSVGTSGMALVPLLLVFTGIVALGMGIQVLIYYPLLLFFLAKKSPRIFFKQASEALLTALSTGSSLASLPMTLKALDGEMGISLESSRLAACVGTNFNHDGILLYEASAALFVAQIFGVSLSLAQQASLIGVSALAAFGIAGVPEAGLITLSLVLSAVGLPLAMVPVLLPMDWLIGRLRAATNVAGDLTVAHLLESSGDLNRPA